MVLYQTRTKPFSIYKKLTLEILLFIEVSYNQIYFLFVSQYGKEFFVEFVFVAFYFQIFIQLTFYISKRACHQSILCLLQDFLLYLFCPIVDLR